MPAPDTQTKESPNPTFWLLALFCGGLITSLSIMGWVYFVHGKEGKEGGAFLLTLLFSIPPLLQILCLGILYRKLRSDKKIRKFYWYCLTLIGPIMVADIGLWAIYTFDISVPEWIDYLPLMLLGLFIIIIGLMTNSLMEPVTSTEARAPGKSKWADKLWQVIILKGLKDSISQAPFAAVLFFFFFFLSLSYLLGFAFAFHGKREFPKPDENRVPALYLAKKYSTDPDEQKELRTDAGMSSYPGGFKADSAQNDEYTFYFDSNSAYMISNDHPANWTTEKKRKKLDKDREELEQWKVEKNEERAGKMIDYILEKTPANERIRIQLRGQTDNKKPDSDKYPDNQALSEARAINMQFTILKKLSEKDGTTPKWRDIEWHYVALSNELPPEVASNEDFHTFLEPLKAEIYSSCPENEKMQLGVMLEKLNDKTLSRQDGNLLLKRIRQALSDIAKNSKLSVEDKASMMKKASADFDKEIKDIHYREQLDNGAQKRIVVASIMPFRPDPTPVHPEYTHLKLLDYMYFTVYTITTTGYGDIVPTTNYAKFLCTLGNFMALFFLVVFFNILLSIRKGEQIITPTREKFDAKGGPGEIRVHAKHGLHWNAECYSHNPDMLTIRSGASGHGSGIICYSVLQNHLPDSQTGRITVAGETFWVEQAGSSCVFKIEDMDKISEFETQGKKQNRLKVTTDDDCSWHVSISNQDMIVIDPLSDFKPSSDFKGSGSLIYSIQPNQGEEREGTISINGIKHTVKQQGAQRNLPKKKRN